MKTRRSRVLAAGLGLGLMLGLVPTVSQAAEPVTDTRRLEAAASVVLRNVKQYDEPTRVSVGNTYNALLAFAAAGEGGAAANPGRAWYLLDALEQRASRSADNPNQSPVKVSGVAQPAVTALADTISVLHAGAVYDQDVTTFADRDWPAELAAFFFADGNAAAGWFKTTPTGTAQATLSLQARGVLALAAAQQTDDAAKAAAALIDKQLASGAWSTSYSGTAASLEATAYAVTALASQDSEAAEAAVARGAGYMKGLQLANGSFTGTDGTTPVLVARAANALRAAGETDSAERAAAFLRDLQVVDADGIDPIYNGAVAATTAQRDQILYRTFSSLNYQTLGTNTTTALLGLAVPIHLLSVTDLGDERPAVEGNDTWKEGACEGDEGVTMVVDFADDNDPLVRCALGTQTSGWSALENAGVAVSSVPGYIGGALCQLDGVPDYGYPGCWTGIGYWSYWHAKPGDLWAYSQLGASNRAPAVGTADGWRFVPLDGAGVPPRVGPTFVPGVDITAPVMAFKTGPSGTVEGAVRWTFTWSLDDLGATQECRLDEDAWAACDEPKTWDATEQSHVVSEVGIGEHVFQVRGTDTWGNTSTISRSFTVIEDVNPPVVTFTQKPGASTSVSNATFAWTVNELEVGQECSLDAAMFAPCTSPVTHSGLAEGEHTFTVRATDLTGNAVDYPFVWTISPDAPPVVTITSGPSTLGGGAYNSSTTQATVNFSIADSGTITSRECKLDDGAWAACSSSTQARYQGLSLADGPHSISVRATNAKGFTSEVATYAWIVDTIKPVVKFTEQPDAATHDRTATIAFEGEDANPIMTVQCKVDNGTTFDCASPLKLTKLAFGQHSVNVTVRDVANNWSLTTHTVSWTVEHKPATVSGAAIEAITTNSARVVGAVDAGNTEQAVKVEYRTEGSDEIKTVDLGELAIGDDTQLAVELTGLKSNTAYQARLVTTTKPDGALVESSWLDFTTEAIVAQFGITAVSGISPKAATVDVAVTPGEFDQQVWVEYRSGSKVLSSAKRQLLSGSDPVALRFELDGLAPNTEFSYRIVADSEFPVTTEWSTFTTAKITSPAVSVTVSKANARVGEIITVSWTTTDAVSVKGSGGLAGDKPLSGKEQVKLTEDGVTSFTITAVGDSGAATTATAKANVTLPARKLAVSTQKAGTIGGKSITVAASGLAAGEDYTIRISGIAVATGKTTSSGKVSRKVTVPKALAPMKHAISVVGSTSDRVGTAKVSVLMPSKVLKVKAGAKVKRGKKVTVKVTKLGAYEPVTIKVGSTKVKKTANAKGAVSVKVTVSKKTKPGKVKVTATGLAAKRAGTTTIKVTK